MSNNEKKLLVDFSKAIAIPLYNTDAIKWPIRSSHIISAINDIYAVEYLNQLYELTENYDPASWIRAFPNALVIWRMAHHIINGLKKANRSPEKIAKDCILMINVINRINHNEQLLDESHRKSLVSDIAFWATKCERIMEQQYLKRLIELSTLLWAYSEALYFQGREVSCEYHGPYYYGEDILLVRDFKNFVPTELWDGEFLDTSVEKIRIITFHSNDVRVTIDAFNNVNLLGGNFAESCKSGIIYVNDKLASKLCIDKLIDEFTYKLEKQLEYVSSLNTTELYQKYVYIFWYRKKGLADFLKHDWLPPKKAVNIISNIDIRPSQKSDYQMEGGIQYLENKYDYSAYI